MPTSLEDRKFIGHKDGNYVLGMPIEDNCDFQEIFNDCVDRKITMLEGCLDDGFFSLFGMTAIDWNPLRSYRAIEIYKAKPLPEACANGMPTLVGSDGKLLGNHPTPDLRKYNGEQKISEIFSMAIDAIRQNASCQGRYIYQLKDGNYFDMEATMIRRLYEQKSAREKTEVLELLLYGFEANVGKNAPGYVGIFGDPMFGNQLAYTGGVLTPQTQSTILYGNGLASTDGVLNSTAVAITNPNNETQVNAKLFIDALEAFNDQRIIDGDLACLNSCPVLIVPHAWKKAVTKIFGITGMLASGCCTTSNLCGTDITTYSQANVSNANTINPFLLEGYSVKIMFTDWLNSNRLSSQFGIDITRLPNKPENMAFLVDPKFLMDHETFVKINRPQTPVKMLECPKSGEKSYIIEYWSGVGHYAMGAGMLAITKYLP